MPAPRTSAPSTTTGSDALLYLLFGVLGAAIAFGSLAWLTGNLTNSLVGAGHWAPFKATDALLHPDVLWPHLSPTALLVGARLVPGLLSVYLTVTGLVLWLRLRGGAKNGLARKQDLAPLLDKEITAKAKSLRPSLSDLKPKDVAPADRGILVGTLSPGRADVRASWEDVIVAIMAPRSGKTSGLAIPAILAAPGPVLLTSNKAANDAFTATVDARAKVGTIWTLDPQQIAHHPREMWWDILADARDLAGAKRLAGHFVAASVDESSGSDFWSTAASNTLGALFLAAASHRRPITDVLAWLASPPTALRWTCSPMPATTRSPPSSRAPSAGPRKRGTASTRLRGSTRAACSTRTSPPGSPPASTFPSSSPPRSPPPATRCTCSARTAAARHRRSSPRRPMR